MNQVVHILKSGGKIYVAEIIFFTTYCTLDSLNDIPYIIKKYKNYKPDPNRSQKLNSLNTILAQTILFDGILRGMLMGITFPIYVSLMIKSEIKNGISKIFDNKK